MSGSKVAQSSKPSTDLPEGVELHGKSLRILFSYRGVRCRETLKGLQVNKANIRFAASKRATILHEIAMGAFDYRAHFPDSPKAIFFCGSLDTQRTVAQGLDTWLANKEKTTAHATYANYKSKANTHVRPKWGSRPIATLTRTEIDTWRTVDLHHLSNKTINEIMIVFRGVLRDAELDGVIERNPAEGLDNLKVHRDEPDPFTRAEIARFIACPTAREQEVAMMGFACWSGLRLSELIAVAWEDIDLTRWVVKVQRANVMGRYKVPKTAGSVREVELLEPAREFLRQQMAKTLMLPAQPFDVLAADNKTILKQSLRMVFLNSNNGKPHANDLAVRERFWDAHLKRAKVRYRGPNHARHTYASQLLTAGVPKEWIANQMGHTSTRMIEERYGKWIREDAPSMAAMVSKMLGFAPMEPQKNEALTQGPDFQNGKLAVREGFEP